MSAGRADQNLPGGGGDEALRKAQEGNVGIPGIEKRTGDEKRTVDTAPATGYNTAPDEYSQLFLPIENGRPVQPAESAVGREVTALDSRRTRG